MCHAILDRLRRSPLWLSIGLSACSLVTIDAPPVPKSNSLSLNNAVESEPIAENRNTSEPSPSIFRSPEGEKMTVLILEDPALIERYNRTVAARADSPVLAPAETLVFFDADTDFLAAHEIALLDRHAHYLAVNPRTPLQIHGHADRSGSERYNEDIARRRAEAVARYLMQRGVSASQIEVFSWGSRDPMDAQDMARNRRVELVYRPEPQEPRLASLTATLR